MEIINYPRLSSSSPIPPDTNGHGHAHTHALAVDGLPSPHLTEPGHSPKNCGKADAVTTGTGQTGMTVPVPASSSSNNSSSSSNCNSDSNSPHSSHSTMLRSLSASASPNINFSIGISASKELSITEYSNKELKAMKKRCRTVMTASQSRVLRKVLEQTAFPSTEIRENLAKLLGMKPRTVQIWFQNQRQKSRQGRPNSGSSSDDLQLDSPNSSGSDDEMSVCSSSPFESSPASMSPSNASSPGGFTALTAAAFALTHSPIDTQQTSHSHSQQNQQNQQNQQRYATFHGAVYKSIPGCLPTILPSGNYYRGNTAAAMNAKRMASAQAQLMSSMTTTANGNYTKISNGNFGQLMMPPPSQPQSIPSYHQNPNQLDVLASAVSKFRPSGYNYFMKPPSPPAQQYHGNQLTYQNQNVPINRNRLPPLRTESASSECPAKLPSLKDLAQVAVTELDHHHHNPQQRSKSFSVESETDSTTKLPIRRFSSAETVSNNVPAPNSSAASTRRPW